ncbi:phage tail sheath family protein [Rubritalea marina]|uniref:phage tail sheath family protein n=1 Tax=Rubritalea marina TaxID=361055 RepID=UPI0012EAA23E|nr:phage tail sheath C-terminal domain-containing protein [Rubritalea marina]
MMNANNPMTPGVYTVEKSAFPPAVAEVPTAIPAFIGYTEFATKNGKPLTEPLLIQSMAEYNQHFGGPPPFQYPIQKLTPPSPGVAPAGYDFEINDNYYKVGQAGPGNTFYLYHCLQLFYQNGGGPCYIASVGTYFSTAPSLTPGAPPEVSPTIPDKDHFLDGLAMLPRIQDPKPTMILTPDSLVLDQADYYTVQEQVLMQCGELKDRVGIIDVYDGNLTNEDAGVIDNFRNMIGNNNMSYGISYYPFLDTTIVEASQVTYANVDQSKSNPDATALTDIFPGAQALNSLASMTEDLKNVEQLTIPAPYNFGNATPPSSVPSKATPGVGPYPNWNVAFSAATPPTPTDFASNLRWQLNVIYSMAFTLSQLGANKSLPYPSVKISSQDLISGIDAMMKPSGYLAGLLYGLAPFDSNFVTTGGKKGLGILTSSTLPKACSTVAGSKAPTISTANPYPATATTPATQYGIINAQIKKVFAAMSNAISQVTTLANTLLTQYNTSFENQNSDYKNLMAGIAKEASLLPPGPALAGVMTMVDDSEGVWVSPANININSVTQPAVSINNDEQASLNVDVIAGKSINAIRAFTGRGPAIIWGARTLDGNSLDWRYVSIRRTMIMIEQSVANAAFQFVFALNNASTWKTVEGMISNFLHNLWSAGCLQGASPADAYSVSVGLGSTMTPVDILEGIMRVEVKVAIVHPAEFIIITYEQEMAKS